jgi:hypothetical protein
MIATRAKQEPDLNGLAEQINKEHAACEAAVRTALEHARKCGEFLVEAKGAIRHGLWEKWIRRNLTVSPRQARNYMTLAKNWDKILHLSKSEPGSNLGLEHLSIKSALRLLTRDNAEWKFADMVCPSCRERLVMTSRRWATCPSCWDCKLYGHSESAIYYGAEYAELTRAERVKEDFRRLVDPRKQAEALVAVLAMLDEKDGLAEAVRLLTKTRKNAQRRQATAVLARLAERSSPLPEGAATG